MTTLPNSISYIPTPVTMIRAPPSRILPGPEDIHYHLERVFMRLSAQYQADFAADPDEDDFGEDLPSIDSPDSSRAASSAYDSAFGCPQWSKAPLQTDGAARSRDAEDSKGKSRAQEQDPSGAGSSSGSQIGSRTPSTGSCVIHRDTPSMVRKAPDSLSREENPDRFVWKSLALPPIHRVNPRVQLAILDRQALYPSFTHDPSALGFPSLQQHSQVSSMRSLFESLSLKSLPERADIHQKHNDSENQQPSSPSTNNKVSSPLNTCLSNTNDKMRGTIQNNANAPQDDDIVMKNGPDGTESDPEIHEPHVPQNKRRSLRLSGDASQKPSPVKKSRNVRKSTGVDTTFNKNSRASKPASTGQKINNVAYNASDAGPKQSVPTQSQLSTNNAATPASTNAQGYGKVQQPQAQVAAQGQPTPVTTSQHQQQDGTSPATQANTRPVSTGPVTNRPMSTSTAKTRSMNAVPANALPTNNVPVNAGPINAHPTNTSPVNSRTPAATSNDDSNNSAANPTPAQAQSFASSQAGIAMNPIDAARGLDSEEWEHMMELSTVFRNHVNHMLVELDNEQDIVDDFGLGALRSQPFGSWHDY